MTWVGLGNDHGLDSNVCLLNELIKRWEQNSWQNLGEKPTRAIFFHLEQHVSNISGLLVSANYENAVFFSQAIL